MAVQYKHNSLQWKCNAVFYQLAVPAIPRSWGLWGPWLQMTGALAVPFLYIQRIKCLQGFFLVQFGTEDSIIWTSYSPCCR